MAAGALLPATATLPISHVAWLEKPGPVSSGYWAAKMQPFQADEQAEDTGNVLPFPLGCAMGDVPCALPCTDTEEKPVRDLV